MKIAGLNFAACSSFHRVTAKDNITTRSTYRWKPSQHTKVKQNSLLLREHSKRIDRRGNVTDEWRAGGVGRAAETRKEKPPLEGPEPQSDNELSPSRSYQSP